MPKNQWIAQAANALKEAGYPIGDAYSLPTSKKKFADGTDYRIEISGVERPSTLEALIKEMKQTGVRVHRIIACLMGSTWLSGQDLKDMAQMCHDENIEMMMFPGQRPQWEGGKQITTPEGIVSGMRLRGQDSVKYYLADIYRGLEAGIRGFLTWDEGVLSVLNTLRTKGYIPAETVFKVSVAAGHGNPAGAKVLQDLGANSFNPVNDVTPAMLAAIRQFVDIPMDIHVANFDSFGGQTRFWELPELIRVSTPCYVKFEPGPSLTQMSRPWLSEETLRNSMEIKVRQVKTVLEIIEGTYPELQQSEQNTKDLAVPQC